MVKNQEYQSMELFFFSFVAKSNFSLKVVSLLCFIGVGSNESIQESSEGVTLLFFFLKLLKEILVSEVGTDLCLGVSLGFQYKVIGLGLK